jgi:hypothetical protein
MPRLEKVDSYFFDGYATIEDDKLLYRKMDGTLNHAMPQETIR